MSDVNANIGVNIDSSQALAELKRLQRQISEFHLSVAKSSEAAALAQKSLQTNFVNSVNSIGAFSAELRTVKTTAESFTSSLENNKLSMREYFRYAGAATKTFGANFKSEFDTIGKVAEERVKTLQTQYIKMGRDANGAMKAIAVRPLTLDMDNLATKTQLAAQKQAIFNQLMKQGSTNLLNFGKNTQWAGRQLMVGFTLPLAAFGATAAKAFQQLETEVVKFKKVYGDLGTTSQQTDKALADIRKLADGYTKYGVEVSKTVALASQAAAAGFQNADLIAQTDAATKLAVLGQIDQQQALETTISLQNAFKISSTDLAGTIDFLNAVENQTVTSLDDITTAIPKVAPVIQSLGGDVKDLAFFLTAMKEGGVNAAEGANALKSGLASLINPSKKASDMLGSMGININNIVTKNQGNLKATVIEFAKALDKLDPLARARAIETMFGKFQFARISTLLNNVTKSGNQASTVLGLAGESAANLAKITSRELGVTAESSLVKFQAAMAKLRASLAPVGEVFMKAFTPILDFISKVLDKFNGLSDGTKKFIAVTVGVVAGLGPILLMTFGLLANGIANIIKLFMTLRNGYQRLTGQSQNLGEQTQYLTTEQLDAAAAAHSLEQSHARLTQQFTVEAGAVNQLRIAYQEAIAAGSAFSFANPGMMKTPKRFAVGGIFTGPGSGTSDSIPAMVSNGEAIIPAKTVAKYPELTAGLIAGNIPGFANGPGRVQVSVPGTFHSGHFGGTGQMTGQELMAYAESISQSAAKKIEAMVMQAQDGLTRLFTVFDNRVVAISDELNLMVGQTGSGKSAPISLARRDLIERGNVAHPELVDQLKKAGMPIEEIKATVAKVTTEIQTGFDKLGNVTTVTAEDIDKITKTAYEKVAQSDAKVNAAYERMQKVTTVADPYARGGRQNRIELGGSYKGKRGSYGSNMLALSDGTMPYSPMGAFQITEQMAAKAKLSARQMADAYKQMGDEAKIRLAALSGDLEKFSVAFEEEALTAGIRIGKAATTGVAKGAKTASNSRATIATGEFIDGGLAEGMIANESVVKAAGNRVGAGAVVAVEAGAKKRRASFRPQGPAAGIPDLGSMIVAEQMSELLAQNEAGSVAAGLPEGFTPTNGVNDKMIGPMTKRQAMLQKLKPKFGLNAGGMKTSVGLMVGSMALSALPEFTGKSLMQSSMNMAAMGAMFGPWGAAAGAAVGLVTAGITALIKKEKEQKAMAEATFKSSADLATYFGNAVVDTDYKLSHYSVTLGIVGDKTAGLRNNTSLTNQELKAFSDMVNSLPEGNPLKDLITGLTNEKNPETINKTTQAFIAMQVATGQINIDQAQKAFDSILATSGHFAMIGSYFVEIKDQVNAVQKILRAASGDTNKFGTTLMSLSAAASNSGSLVAMQAILNGIATSGFNGAAGIQALINAYNSIGLTGKGTGASELSRIKGMNLSNIIQAQTAADAGLVIDLNKLKDKKSIMDAVYKFLAKNGTYGMQQSAATAKTDTPQIKALKAQVSNRDASIKLLEKEKKIIDDKIKKEQAITNELKKQNDYIQSQQEIDKKIIEANLHGDYIGASLLGQQKLANTVEYNHSQKVDALQAQSDAYAKSIEDLKTANETNTTAIDNLTSAIKDNGTGGNGGGGGNGNGGIVAPDRGKGTDSVHPYIPPVTPKDISNYVNSNTRDPAKAVGVSMQQAWQSIRDNLTKNLDPANAWKNWKQLGHADFDKYIKSLIGNTAIPDGGIVVELPGSDGLFYQFKIKKDKSVIRMNEPIKRADGGYIKHFEPGGTVNGPGTATSDSIPAMLSNGEYVVKASAVDKYGVPLLHALNSEKLATGGGVGRNRLSASHMSSSKINKDFVTPTQIEEMLAKQGVDSSKFTDKSRKLPSTVTPELLRKIMAQQAKPGSLAHYQQMAISAMKGSERSEDFMLSHLNDATAMNMPNWNLPGRYARLAKEMADSGRTKAFIRSKLGLSSDTFVPGKWATGGMVGGYSGGGMPQMPTEESTFKMLMKQKDRFLPEALKAFKKQYGDNTLSSPGGFGPGTWSDLSLANYIREHYLKTTQANRLNDYAKNMTRYGMHHANGGLIQHFGGGGMPNPFSIGMSKAGDFFNGVQKKVVNPIVNNPLTRFAKNELLGIDDLQTAYRKGMAGDDLGAMRAGAVASAELLSTVAGGEIFKLGFKGMKFAAKPLAKLGIGKNTFSFIKNLTSSIGSKTFNGIKGGINKTGNLASSIGSKIGNISVKNRFENMYARGYDAAHSPSWEKPVFKAQEMIKKAENSIAGQKFLEKFAILSSKGLGHAEIFANSEFEALRSAAGWDKNYLNNLWSAAGHTVNLPEKEIKAFYKSQIAQIKKGEKLAGKYLKSPLSYLSRIRQAGKDASPMGQSILSKADGFFGKFGFGAIKNKVSSFVGNQKEALGFASAVKSLRNAGLHNDPKAIAAVEKYGYGINNPTQYLAPNASTSAAAMLADYDKKVAFQKLLEAFVWKVKSGIPAVEAIQANDIVALGEKAGMGPEYLNNLHASAGHLVFPSVDATAVIKEFKGRFATLDRGKRGAQSYLSSPLTLLSRLRDKLAIGAESKSGGFSSLANSTLVNHLLEGNLPLIRPIKNIAQTYMGRTRSQRSILEQALLHPNEVPIDNARAYGPGTYFAKTMQKSEEIFSAFGNNIYRSVLSPKAFLKVALSKGYITQNMLEKEALKFGEMSFANSHLTNLAWDHPFIQHLQKKGYIGYQHRDALTSWLTGTKGFGLKAMQVVNPLGNGASEIIKMPSKFEGLTQEALNVGKQFVGLPMHEITSKIYDAYQVAQQTNIGQKLPKFHDWNGTVPGPYGQELNAVLKSGTEGVYQNQYIAGLKNAAAGNSSTSNANTVYNIDMTVNGGSANANEIANQVMAKLKVVASQNNKTNKVTY